MRRGLVVVGVAGVAAAGLLWLRRRARARRIPDSEEAKRGVVADAYTATAKGQQSCCVSVKKGDAMGYSAADRALSATAGSDLGLGCGNPVELANLAEGEVVTVEAGQNTVVAVDLPRLPVLPLQTMSADFHVHGATSFDSTIPSSACSILPAISSH